MAQPIIQTTSIIEQSLCSIDKFIKSASMAAYKKGIQNVGVVSCRYSLNLQKNNIKNFVVANPGRATRLLVPILLSNRIVLAAFYWDDTRVEYFDSLKLDLCEQFHVIRDAVEKFLGLKFNMTNQKVINDSINDNPVPVLANVHICRIAEDLCFLQRYQKLENLNIHFEAKRIKKILDIVANPKWSGEWLETSRDKQFDDAIDAVIINNLSTSYDHHITPSTSGLSFYGNDAITERIVICGVPILIQNMLNRNKQIDSTINEVVENVNRQFENEAVTVLEFQQREIMANMSGRTAAKSLKMSEIVHLYDTKYPVLSKMLKFYSKLSKLRNDTYKDTDVAVTFQKNFNWKLYSDLNTFEKEKGSGMLKDFPFIAELSHVDKSFILHRFWTPFWFFERICDTLVTFGDAVNGNFVMLQDKSIYDLNALMIENNFGNRKEWKNVENLVFGYWNTVLKKMKELKPDIIEIMYIFCCILWNVSYLNVALSEDGEDTVRRGRLIIHNEMREFYEYDDEKWKRIYSLRNILLLTENSVKDYKKGFVVV